MQFTKMEGCGNDYIYVDCFSEDVKNPEELAKTLSDRHFGIGADGLILIKPSNVADCFMDIYNADGNRAEMCGNGIRCVGKYVYDHGIVTKSSVTVETLAGMKTLELHIKNSVCVGAEVNMGAPVLIEPHGNPDTLLAGTPYRVTCVSMGNPHAVVLVDDPKLFDVHGVGKKIETHPAFPNRVNAHFIKVHAPDRIEIRTWERGAGETLACGTGNCAALVAATLLGLSDGEADMQTLGGVLHIRWDRESGNVYMSGAAREVFAGEVSI